MYRNLRRKPVRKGFIIPDRCVFAKPYGRSEIDRRPARCRAGAIAAGWAADDAVSYFRARTNGRQIAASPPIISSAAEAGSGRLAGSVAGVLLETRDQQRQVRVIDGPVVVEIAVRPARSVGLAEMRLPREIVRRVDDPVAVGVGVGLAEQFGVANQADGQPLARCVRPARSVDRSRSVLDPKLDLVGVGLELRGVHRAGLGRAGR